MGSRQRDKEAMLDSSLDGGRSGAFAPRKRPRPPEDLVIDYKDTDTLRSFLSEGGRIVPARVNRLSCKQQRRLTREVKRAQHLALLPMSDSHRGFHG